MQRPHGTVTFIPAKPLWSLKTTGRFPVAGLTCAARYPFSGL